MATTLTKQTPVQRRPLTELGKLTVWALVGIGGALLYLQAMIIGMLIPPLAVFVVISLVLAGIVTLGWRWAPVLGAVWSLFIVAGNAESLRYNLAHPELLHSFTFSVLLAAIALVGLIAGISATLQNYRGRTIERGQRAPAAMRYSLTALIAGVVGAVLVAAIPQPGAVAGVTPAALAELDGLVTDDFQFDRREIRAKVGETVALRLDNPDREAHSFDIDELQVHVPMPVGKSSLALFKPDKAGTYKFYCGVPEHRDIMVGTLLVE